MAGEEGCSGSCRPQAGALERKIVQTRMEVSVEEDCIWWSAERNQVATKSGKATTVLRDGEAILEDGLRVWKPGDDGPILARVEGANLPHRRGRDRLQKLVKNKQREEHGMARLLLQCSGGVCREGYFLLPHNE